MGLTAIGGMIDAMKSSIPGRVELFHPLFVHFPIAFLLLGSIIWILSMILQPVMKNEIVTAARRGAFVVIGLGLLCGIAALKTGELAEDVVNQVICDPTITHDHDDWAHWTMAVFAAGLFVAGVTEFLSAKRRWKSSVTVGRTVVTLAFIGGMACLTWTGHLSGRLVYEQGAAVANAKHEPCPENG